MENHTEGGVRVDAMVRPWIKFQDQLPEDRKQIIISGFINDNHEMGRWVEAAWHDRGDFYTDEDDISGMNPAGFYEPTHWMPMPEPPSA